MKRSIQILARLYALVLNLYPCAYQVEYGEELQAVFYLAVNDAAQRDGLSVLWMGLRELRDLPCSIILEHWRERRKHNMATERGSLFTFKSGSWREALAALVPFLLAGVSTLLDYLPPPTILPQWLEIVIAILLLGSLLSLSVIGVTKRFPRWFLPYVGLLFPLFSAYIISDLVPNPYDVLPAAADSWLLRQITYSVKLWIGLLVAGLFVVLIARLLPPLRPFYVRVRRDWTLLSFILYGATLFCLLAGFDDYVGEEPYQIMALLLLAGGGWVYLRSARPWRRIVALLGGLTLAMAVAAAGKVILRSSANWPYARHVPWQPAAMSVIIMWGWLALVISAPALLNLLPRSDEGLRTE